MQMFSWRTAFLWPLILFPFFLSIKLRKNVKVTDASHSQQSLVKGERLVRYEVNAVTNPCDEIAKICKRKFLCLDHKMVILLSFFLQFVTYRVHCHWPVPCQRNTWRLSSKLRKTLSQARATSDRSRQFRRQCKNANSTSSCSAYVLGRWFFFLISSDSSCSAWPQ